MNAILQLIFSTLLLVQLGNASFIPFHNLKDRGTHRRTLSKHIINNYVDDYEPQTKGEDLKSQTCAYYDYKDECHNTNDGCGVQTYITCRYSTNNPACYSMWNGNRVILQGCWAPTTREQCTPGRCVSGKGLVALKSVYHFCCCYGDNCNEKYGLSNNIPRWL